MELIMKSEILAKFLIVTMILLTMAGSALAGDTDISSKASKSADVDARPNDEVKISGTIKYNKIEGGFWGFVGDDGRNYEPNIPEKYRREGLRVILHGKIRNDAVSFTMTGPVIEVNSIEVIKDLRNFKLLK